MFVDSSRYNWYVIYTMPKAEKRVFNLLYKNNCQVFLPLYRKTIQWSDRKKKILAPLFPNYIFAFLNQNDLHSIYGIPGFVKFLSTRGQKDTVPQREIDSIKLLLQSNPRVSNERILVGDIMVVKKGPLQGLVGIVIEKRGSAKLAVRIESLALNLVVEISPDQVKPIQLD
ncbi:MAG: UpxY family transcription antiterminator [Cyclobacteriaceae bacterium]